MPMERMMTKQATNAPNVPRPRSPRSSARDGTAVLRTWSGIPASALAPPAEFSMRSVSFSATLIGRSTPQTAEPLCTLPEKESFVPAIPTIC